MKSHVTWALVGASVVLLGFTSLQFTDAAWSSSQSTDGATVSTGHLRITGSGQLALDVSGLTKEEMAAGGQAQIPLTVVNDSTIPVSYRLAGVTAAAGSTPPELDLRVAQVSQEGDCPTSGPFGTSGTELYSGEITDASTADIDLDVSGDGATDVLCLTTTAGTVLTPGLSGSYVFTFRADQQ
ncbi:hypothetical protein K3888_14485 [Dietzia aurantiaca]|uniref:hypothetical protein n=1 Tax=Dietzia aurantiaca TaxID=983873 RepID=UPI001E4D853E|nr:hypothetical protein [Dietzia aurantiaca]MCD2263906.1 hypothetical protein [Dietzia aurantiaca]